MNHLMLGIVLSVALIGCTDKEVSTAKNTTEKQTAADVRAGKAITERDCKGCHGLNGGSSAPAIPHLAAQRESYLLASLKAYKEGKRSHAALRNMAEHMSDADLRNVAAYYASLPPIANASGKDVQLVFPYEKGKTLAADCAKCHSEDGNSKIPGTPSLAGQQPLYFVAAIQEYLHAERKTAPMHAMLRRLNKLDRESVALYFASQTPAQRAAPSLGDAAAGEPLSAVCGGCHGPNGVSTDATTPSLASQDPKYLVDAIKAYRSTRKHEGMRHSIADLSDKDIENIVAFYTVQKSKAAEKGQTFIQDLAEKCNRCHGPDADNSALAVPKISGQDKDYLIMALRAYRDDRRESTMMHRMSLPYSDSIIESIAALYASQPAK
jgi:cytochrome c553